MGFALEILIVPVLLLTVIAILLLASEPGTAIAGAAGLALLYFVVFNLLRSARREEKERGDDQHSGD
jgi:threonine/homoserine/homoserine lactone efflux protein